MDDERTEEQRDEGDDRATVVGGQVPEQPALDDEPEAAAEPEAPPEPSPEPEAAENVPPEVDTSAAPLPGEGPAPPARPAPPYVAPAPGPDPSHDDLSGRPVQPVPDTDRPEVLVGAAFVGGFVLAKILGKLRGGGGE
jgi:hypothetical protein